MEYKDFIKQIVDIHKEAEQEIIKLLKENNLTELKLSDNVDYTYAQIYEEFIEDHIVKKVFLLTDEKGRDYIEYQAEDISYKLNLDDCQFGIVIDLYESVYQTLNEK